MTLSRDHAPCRSGGQGVCVSDSVSRPYSVRVWRSVCVQVTVLRSYLNHASGSIVVTVLLFYKQEQKEHGIVGISWNLVV